jgi:prepilin-type N-terminal cleavage/methylation domain-containing protein
MSPPFQLQRRDQRVGFTLVELLVVLAIVAVLAALGLAGSSTFIKRSAVVKDMFEKPFLTGFFALPCT